MLFAKKFDQYDVKFWEKLKFIVIHYNKIKYLLSNATSINKTNNE